MKYVFKTYNEREIKKLEKNANEILKLEEEYKKLNDEELKNKTYEFKRILEKGRNLDSILIEAFATCREATNRILNKKQYKVQLMGGIALHQGRIVEMKTGEGKTLTELCPAYLNALDDKGVHIITANEYLAQRDKDEMKKVFEFLNISVGLVIEKTENKKEEYSKDVVYSTNTQLGFDYLRDNLVYNIDNKVQRELNYVIIDEVDSVLIDEARTPLIISQKIQEDSEIYGIIDKIIKKFNEEDYYIDKRDESIFLSDKGMKRIEEELEISDLTQKENIHINHVAMQSLRANFILHKDIDYIIENNEILLIDQNTGRVAEGRMFGDELQQCIEAKEGLEIKSSSKTLANITYQFFFKLYEKMAGMSGTVKTEEMEFREIYNLDVVAIPTNKEIKRNDNKDKIFKDDKSKFISMLKDIKDTHEKGQPILIGTQSIKESEKIANLLEKNNISFKLLNAKTKEEEAEIIKNAGNVNSIIVATNIAGRGTDIKLTDEALNLGGLKIIGIGKSEALRIDNQLIGRAGRQGEIGESQFYISCEDEILSVYGDNKLKDKIKKNKNLINSIGQIDNKIADKFIKAAQRYVNGENFEIRKRTVEFDEVINIQRTIIYMERNNILKSDNISGILSYMVVVYVEYMIETLILDIDTIEIEESIRNLELNYLTKEDKDELRIKIKAVFSQRLNLSSYSEEIEQSFFEEELLIHSIENISNYLIETFNRIFEIKNMNEEVMKLLFINTIDFKWQEHLTNMEYLKEYVRDQSYSQKNPIDVYRLEGKKESENLSIVIRVGLIENLFNYIIHN